VGCCLGVSFGERFHVVQDWIAGEGYLLCYTAHALLPKSFQLFLAAKIIGSFALYLTFNLLGAVVSTSHSRSDTFKLACLSRFVHYLLQSINKCLLSE